MMPENTEMKLVFLWLVSDITMLLPGELNLLHTVFPVGFIWLQHIGKVQISSDSNIRR
jgi:hypothetical protein